MVNLDQELGFGLESGNFELALPLIEEYGRSAIEHAEKAGTLAEQSEILQSSVAFLEERLHLARVMRAQLASRIVQNSRLSLYRNTSSLENSWKVEA